MCEDLVEECGDPRLSRYLPGYCAAYGRAGLEDERNEDQCFAVYDDCIDECVSLRYLLELGAFGEDASSTPDAGSSGDAALAPAADAGAGDAGASTDSGQ